MTNIFTKTTLAAILAVATLAGATGNASALSIQLPPGVELQQTCYQKPVKVTKYVQVVRYNKWVTVPKTVTVYKTVCKDYHTWTPGRQSGHQNGHHSGHQNGYQQGY